MHNTGVAFPQFIVVVNDILFWQHAVIELFVKENNSATDISGRLSQVQGDACMGASSVRRWVKHFKDGEKTDIADQPCCGQLRTPLGVGHHAVQEMIATL